LRESLKILCLCTAVAVFASSNLFAFGDLAEFLNAGLTELHDGVSDPILSTDVIKSPSWSGNTVPDLRLCNSGASYTGADIHFQASGMKDDELLADLNSGQTAFTNVGSSLSFSTAVLDSSTGCISKPNGGSVGEGVAIYFTSALPSGVLGFTSLDYTISGGQLLLDDAAILFNPSVPYATKDCHTAGSPSGDCTPLTPDGSIFSFLGVFTHELGHLVGISHTLVNDDNSSDGIDNIATMFPAISGLAQSKELESLITDDELSLQKLYPGSGFPGNTGGTVSGNVYTALGVGARGAHVTIFNTNAEKAGTAKKRSGNASFTMLWVID